MYKNSQFAWGIWLILAWISTFLGLALAIMGPNIGVIGFSLVLLVIAVLFYGLTVEVNNQTISWWFGFGFAKKSIPFGEIKHIKSVRNSLRHGIGMRITNDGWVYTVFGFDAIEITLNDGMKYRVGTNDKSALLKALKSKVVSEEELNNKEPASTDKPERKDAYDI